MQSFQKTSPLDCIFGFDINCWAFIELLRSTKIMKLVVTMRKTWICSKHDWKKSHNNNWKLGLKTIAVNLIENEFSMYYYRLSTCLEMNAVLILWYINKIEMKNDRVKSSFDFALFG